MSLYLDLLKRCVSNTVYDDDLDLMRGRFIEKGGRYVSEGGLRVEPQLKYLGDMWPSKAHTMIGIPRLENLQACIEEVVRNEVSGDFIECGVWRGGASIFMAGALKIYGLDDSKLWVADSFEGMPKADRVKYPKECELDFDKYQDLSVSLEEVKRNFTRYGLLDDRVKFLKGWFKDTLPKAPIEKLALMRLDGDLYESTWDCLTNLYPKLSTGGFVIVDDYNSVKSCTDAVDDFRTQFNVKSELELIQGSGAYWKK